MKFGSRQQPARRDHRRVRCRRPRRACSAEPGSSTSIDVKADAGVSQDEVVANIRTALTRRPRHRERRGDQRRGSSPRARTTSRTTSRSSTRSCSIFGVVALLVGSFIIFNTFSIIVAQRGRELALLRAIGAGQRQVLGSVLFEAVLVGLIASTVGFVAGIGARGRAQGAARARSASTSLPATIVIPASAIIWSYVLGMVVTVVAAMAPALQGVADPADRGDARRVDRPLEHVAAAHRLRARSSRSSASVLLALGLFGDSGLLDRRARDGCRVPRRRGPRPDDRGADQRRARHPDPQVQGRHRSDRRENAMRNPKRTSATAAALMIGVGLVGLITVFAASARTSVDAAIDRSMKADYVDERRPASARAPSRSRLSDAAGGAARSRPRSSGIRSGQAKIDGLGHSCHRRRPGQDRLAVRPPSRAGQDLRAQRRTASRCSTAPPATTAWKLGEKVPITFAQTGTQQFTVESIYDAVGLHQLRDHDRRLREELHGPVRLPGVRQHEGWRHAREHAPRSSR